MAIMAFENIAFDWITRESGRVAVGADEVVTYLGGNLAHVSRYVKEIFPDYRFQSSQGKTGRPKWFLYEPGVYQMIFSSSLSAVSPEKVEKFQRWVFESVLPDLRENGAYIDKTRFTPEQVESHTELIESFKNSTENLLKDCQKILNRQAKLLVHGFIRDGSKGLPYNTFSQIHKHLVRMGFNYDSDRFKLAMKRFRETSENPNMRYVTQSDKTSRMDEDDIELFMECVYSSMRYEGDTNDTDTSSNMYWFQTHFGKKYGKHTSFEQRTENIVTHMEDASKLINE